MVNKGTLAKVFLSSSAPIGAFSAIQEGSDYKIIVNYNGQADLLLSLQIPPDYYPYQFKKNKLYEYLSDSEKYIVVNHKTSNEKNKIKHSFQRRLDNLLGTIKEFGPSLWNKSIYDSGLVYRNDQFWNSKRTNLLFLEQFIADDYTDISQALDILPSHKRLIITNHRAARDPYTIFSKDVFECFKSSCNNSLVANKLRSYLKNYRKNNVNSLYRFGRYIEFWNKTFDKENIDPSEVSHWLKSEKLFSLNPDEDKKISHEYKEALFSEEEMKELKEWKWEMNYGIKLTHHPALEQQTIPGSSPLAEGSQKEVMVFLFQFASLIDQYTKTSEFNKEFKGDYRESYMKNALSNAKKIGGNLRKRIGSIREYFKEIGVVDKKFDPDKGNYTNEDSKVFAVVTFPPTAFGGGEAMIQSMSKYPFIYYDIGLKQAVPLSFSESHEEHHHDSEAFSMDDNGWWWRLGNANLDPKKILDFKGTIDKMILLANEEDWNLLNEDSSKVIKSISTLLKDSNISGKFIRIKDINSGVFPVNYSKYHLWNEGLRSPIALNLLLDNLVDIFQKQYDPEYSGFRYSSAMDWGNYWSEDFI